MMSEWIYTCRNNDHTKFIPGVIHCGSDLKPSQSIPQCIGMTKVETVEHLQDYAKKRRQKNKPQMDNDGLEDEFLGQKHFACIIGTNLALYQKYMTLGPFEGDEYNRVSEDSLKEWWQITDKQTGSANRQGVISKPHILHYVLDLQREGSRSE